MLIIKAKIDEVDTLSLDRGCNMQASIKGDVCPTRIFPAFNCHLHCCEHICKAGGKKKICANKSCILNEYKNEKNMMRTHEYPCMMKLTISL